MATPKTSSYQNKKHQTLVKIKTTHRSTVIIKLVDALQNIEHRPHDPYKTEYDTEMSMSDNNGGVIYF